MAIQEASTRRYPQSHAQPFPNLSECEWLGAAVSIAVRSGFSWEAAGLAEGSATNKSSSHQQ